MKLEAAMRMASVCGLKTLEEAVCNIDRHAMSFFEYSQIPSELKELYDEYEAWIAAGNSNLIPEYIHEEENRKMDEFFWKCADEGGAPVEEWEFKDTEIS